MNYLLAHIPDFSTWTTSHIIIAVVAMLGALLMIYGVFLESERRQDLVFLVAGGCLFVYATYIQNKLFAVAMFGFSAASLVEFIEILLGKHHHVCYPSDAVKDPKGKIYQIPGKQ